jgi:hypothetical protein
VLAPPTTPRLLAKNKREEKHEHQNHQRAAGETGNHSFFQLPTLGTSLCFELSTNHIFKYKPNNMSFGNSDNGGNTRMVREFAVMLLP